MAQPILIPADLWQRLAALDRRCNIGLVRGDWEVPGGGGFVRVWRVTISERRGSIYDIVRFDAPALAHALEGDRALLATELTRAHGSNLSGKGRAGVHIAGYERLGEEAIPVLYHVHVGAIWRRETACAGARSGGAWKL